MLRLLFLSTVLAHRDCSLMVFDAARCVEARTRAKSAALHERSPSVNGLDQAAISEDGHRVADGVKRDAVVAGEVAFGQQACARAEFP
jgi:hypothetical protein